MKTQEFLELLKEHQNKSLVFEYKEGAYVGANYHITEVKNIAIEAVDCGARTDSWKETIVQLWESPKELDKTEFMSAYKALAILNKVHKMRPMDLTAELKLEYGNASFHTAQLFVNETIVENDRIIIGMGVEKTDCKAKDECGIPATVGATSEAVCAPGNGCC